MKLFRVVYRRIYDLLFHLDSRPIEGLSGLLAMTMGIQIVIPGFPDLSTIPTYAFLTRLFPVEGVLAALLFLTGGAQFVGLIWAKPPGLDGHARVISALTMGMIYGMLCFSVIKATAGGSLAVAVYATLSLSCFWCAFRILLDNSRLSLWERALQDEDDKKEGKHEEDRAWTKSSNLSK